MKKIVNMTGTRMLTKYPNKIIRKDAPKVLIFDIETAPLLIRNWSLWQKFTPLDMLKEDWFIMSWAARWIGTPKRATMYEDLQGTVKSQNDKKLLKHIWKLLDTADVVVTQNGIKFDAKKLAARFIANGYGKPSPYRHVDTLKIAKKEFGFTSNKLEYMTDQFCTKYKKLKHGKFAGFELWKECLAENPAAWKEMKKYNMYDTLSLEELYMLFRAWDSKHPNIALFNDDQTMQCNCCGSTKLKENGYSYTNASKFQRYRCTNCGKPDLRGKTNLLSKEKRRKLLMNTL